MNFWIILGRGTKYDNWEVLDVLFDAIAVEAKVKKIFTEYKYYTHVKAECWYRENANSLDAGFYETKTYLRYDYVKEE